MTLAARLPSAYIIMNIGRFSEWPFSWITCITNFTFQSGSPCNVIILLFCVLARLKIDPLIPVIWVYTFTRGSVVNFTQTNSSESLLSEMLVHRNEVRMTLSPTINVKGLLSESL